MYFCMMKQIYKCFRKIVRNVRHYISLDPVTVCLVVPQFKKKKNLMLPACTDPASVLNMPTSKSYNIRNCLSSTLYFSI